MNLKRQVLWRVCMSTLLALLFAPIFLLGTHTSTVFAQESSESSSSAQPVLPLNITLSPISLSFTTKPGEKTTQEIRVRNNGSTTEEITLGFGTFKAQGKDGKPLLLDVKGDEPFLSWLTFDQPDYSIQPGEWKTITVTFAPPKDAALSYYYTIIFSRKEKSQLSATTLLNVSPAMLVLALVDNPQAKRELELLEFAPKHKIVEFLPTEFLILAKNTGNVHAAPTGTIFIDGQGKKDLAVLSLNPEGGYILPQTEREFVVSWKDGFPAYEVKQKDGAELKDKKGDQQLELRWDFSKADRFRFGMYTAKLIFVYDDGQRDVPVEKEVSFWVVPWRLLLAAAVVAGLCIYSVIALFRGVFRKVRHSDV
jgi:hypothetical protein